MFPSVIQLPWILRGQLRAQAGSEDRCPGEGPAGSADVSGEPANSQRPHPRHVAPRAVHPRAGCQVAGRCSPLLGRPPPSRMWDPRPCHPRWVAILGLPCPTLIRSGLQKMFQDAPARGSVFLPPPEGMQEACVLGALGSAQGWPTCSLGWMALDVSHGPGRQAGPSPAMPPLRSYRGSLCTHCHFLLITPIPFLVAALAGPQSPEPQASHFPSQDQVSSSRKCMRWTTSPGPRQPTPRGHSPLGADWLPSLGWGPRPGLRDWTEFSRPFMDSHPTLWSWALSASTSLPVTRGLMVPSTYS